jgi:predicted house-cleaning noncanonical NTP pyrophosphatase (MazG superfamily)
MSTPKRFKIDQIIRDKLPEIMRSQGIAVFERPLEGKELDQRMREKLLLEAREVQNAQSTEELIEELADVLEVMHALAKAAGVDLQRVEEKRTKKLQARGGFEARLYNPYVEVDEASPAIEYYLSRPAQYPQVVAE